MSPCPPAVLAPYALCRWPPTWPSKHPGLCPPGPDTTQVPNSNGDPIIATGGPQLVCKNFSIYASRSRWQLNGFILTFRLLQGGGDEDARRGHHMCQASTTLHSYSWKGFPYQILFLWNEMTAQKSKWMKENITTNLWVRFQTIFKGLWTCLWIANFILPACALLILAIFM